MTLLLNTMHWLPAPVLGQLSGQGVPLQADPRAPWAAVVLLIVVGVGFAIANIALSIFVGPSRTGPGKETTYESGMVPIGEAQRRFNVRFYIVAMIFLVFDVDIIFFYPWAAIFPQAVASKNPELAANGMHMSTLLLVDAVIFVVLLLWAYLYAWGKGVFRWD